MRGHVETVALAEERDRISYRAVHSQLGRIPALAFGLLCSTILPGIGRLVMANATRLLIKNGTLIDGSGGDPVPNRLLVVERDRITLVGETGGSMRPENQ
jgi:hypothetical protein